ncbi:hypothetical protein AMK59_7289, partial [Oryctes borbonicus]
MCNKQNKINIDIKITDIVVTPLTCTSIVNEIIKFLVYQKSQIPYPYNWLQTVITRKRKSTGPENIPTSNNLFVERHYKTASIAYDTIEAITKGIKIEFKNSFQYIKEVLIIFGTTLYTAKEVFRINMPILQRNHIEANHIKFIQKNQQKILRHIFLSQDWLKAMENVCPTTNMYVMLKKYREHTNEESIFIPTSSYDIPINSNCITINLDYKDENDHVCCSNITVFNDSISSSHKTSHIGNNMSHKSEEVWYEAKLSLKGFKDCFINKVSAT